MTASGIRATIYVNGRFLRQRITGVQRYAHEVLTALDRLLAARLVEPLPVTVLVPPGASALPQWTALRTHQVGRFSGQLWEQIDLPTHAANGLLFTPCGGAPIAHRRQVITIHDAAPFSTPNAYTVAYRSYYRTLQRILARAAIHIITVSSFSRQELMRFLRVPPERITGIWLSGEHILRHELDEAVLAKHHLFPGKYILAVGSRNPNKNLHGLVEAFRRLSPPEICLAVAGGSDSSVFRDTAKIGDSVQQLGFVTDAELRTLYQHAACFVFPSFYEGFGIPPLEALSTGTPIVVSRAASLPEIFGDAAAYCDPHSPEDIARTISQVVRSNPVDRAAAIEHASRFTWDQCARRTWAILTNALEA
jgi:glycosyltransferase involved in cell wall biosynthesis